MIKNGQFDNQDGLSVWDKFRAPAAKLHLIISMLLLLHNFATKPDKKANICSKRLKHEVCIILKTIGKQEQNNVRTHSDSIR
ncbi:hypothetical protein [Candidatus Enterovibrio escicola]|uniref:Uncharacterized protein n=1 Tax=Candidatus Enterovibrio escicola TaxID=1927127 RepID=A0A2A5T5P1_9GAMM|nr:hypothetical protein BTN49_0431 [Candidatus Enterovibrio escacola]